MVMADFTGSEAEELRRAMSFHRSQERMEKVEVKLRAAMERKGISTEVIEEIVTGDQELRALRFSREPRDQLRHPGLRQRLAEGHRAPEFFASLLNNQPMGFYSSATLVKDARRHGVKTRPVCVQHSEWACTIEGPTMPCAWVSAWSTG